MCNFFSFITKGGQRYYFDWEDRQKLFKDNPENYNQDSHSSISAYHKLDDDKVNKYEYNPLTKIFSVDIVNIKDDRALAKKWVENLDFSKIIEPLAIKPIIHPFKLPKAKITDEHKHLLKEWDSVRDSVWASVRASVRDSVRDSVWASVGASVGASVRASVGASVWASVGASVRASVGAYTSSFFNLENWKYIEHPKNTNPFQSGITLWEQGIVPSFDGTIWRLHSGKKSDVIFEISRIELEKL